MPLNSNPSSQHLLQLIDDALEQHRDQETPRHYLGASRLGVECLRALQYEYLHTPKDAGQAFSPRLLRIFEAGHVFESLMLRWLTRAGLTIKTHTPSGEPYGFSALDGRLRGHVDGIITSLPKVLNVTGPVLWECKSLKHSEFLGLVKKGVHVAKPVYAAQMAIYQAYMEAHFVGLSENPALFSAIDKDTAQIHIEWVTFDGELAQRVSDKALNIIEASDINERLPRVAKDASFYQCRLCAWQTRCWQTSSKQSFTHALTPEPLHTSTPTQTPNQKPEDVFSVSPLGLSKRF